MVVVTRGPRFKFRHWQTFIKHLVTLNFYRKDENNAKAAGNGWFSKLVGISKPFLLHIMHICSRSHTHQWLYSQLTYAPAVACNYWTRLGDFWKIFVTKILSKVAQMYGNYLGCLEFLLCLNSNCCGNIHFGNLRKSLGRYLYKHLVTLLSCNHCHIHQLSCAHLSLNRDAICTT